MRLNVRWKKIFEFRVTECGRRKREKEKLKMTLTWIPLMKVGSTHKFGVNK